MKKPILLSFKALLNLIKIKDEFDGSNLFNFCTPVFEKLGYTVDSYSTVGDENNPVGWDLGMISLC